MTPRLDAERYRLEIDELALTWDSPDGGSWGLEAAHFPHPVSRLFADVIDRVYAGWFAGATAYGLPRQHARWAHVNGYLYYGKIGEAYPADEQVAGRAVRERWWLQECDRWFADEKPAAVRRNLELQAVDPRSLDEAALRDHIGAALQHLLDVGSLHFVHRGRQVVRDELRRLADAEGIPFDELTARFAGGSPATSRPAHLVASIADALRDGGVDPASVHALDHVSAAPDAARLLDEYLEEFGHRLLDSYDLACPTLHERPEVVIASIRAAAQGSRPPEPAPLDRPDASDELRSLFEEARIAHGTEDDDDGVCLFWPSGLLRRGLLELGRRRGLPDPAAIFEQDVDELRRTLDGGGPSDDELDERLRFRLAAAAVTPPPLLGGSPEGPGSQPAPGDDLLTGTGVGEGVVRGRACVVRGHDSHGLADLEPGDVLIAVTTTPGYNAVMPILAGVATETHMGHTVICARELGIPAVVGVRGLLDAIPHLATVELDAARGIVRLIG